MSQSSPSNNQRYLSHAIIGAGVGYLASVVFKTPTEIKIAAAVIGIVAHEELDAPLAKALASLAA